MKNKLLNQRVISFPLARPYFDAEELAQVQEVLDSGWVSQGPKVKELEDELARRLGVNYAISVVNCTSALHLSLLALGIKEGNEVLVADFTFPAAGHSVLYCKANPIFIDVDPKTYNIAPNLIEDKVTPKTKAIIPVHTFGQPADMDVITEIARRHNLKIVEDAACALGAKYKDRYAGTIGDIGCFSFHARKNMTTGEGGMVVTNNKELAGKIRTLSVFGMDSAWEREQAGEVIIPEFVELGYNYKMSDITAAIGVAQLGKLDKLIARRRKLAKYWDRKLEAIELIKPPYCSEDVLHVYQSYVALVDRRVDRNLLMQKLLDQGIQTQIGTYASHIQPIYRSEQRCTNSLDIFRRSLALPMYYTLKEEDIDFIAMHLGKALPECLLEHK
jgi:dTDP-4-amino-4,6-dideoxygalactose transaminase